MKIFLATAKLADIRWAEAAGLIDGVATSPTLLAAENPDGDGRSLLEELCRETTLPVLVHVGALSAADIYRNAKDLARISEHIVVQIPLVEDSVGAMKKLRIDGVRVTATLIYNAAQAVLAAKAGASTVSTAVDQLNAIGRDGYDLLREIRDVFDASDTECDVHAAMPQNATEFASCALAGADSVSVSPTVLRSLLLHPLTDRGLDQLLHELSRTQRSRAAV